MPAPLVLAEKGIEEIPFIGIPRPITLVRGQGGD